MPFGPATWDEALDRAANGFRSAVEQTVRRAFGLFSCSKTHERDELPRAEVRADRGRQQQHRQLQPDLTRPERRRSGDGFRGGRRDELLPGDRGDGSSSCSGAAMRARRTRSSSTTCSRASTTGRGSTPSTRADARLGRVGGSRGSASTSAPTSRWPMRWRARSSRPGLENRELHRATRRAASRTIARHVEPYTLEYAERDDRRARRAMIRDMAHAYARADRAQICWTLGITEHHNAVDNVLALINLALLTGHVGRYGSGPQSAARTEQRAGRRRHGRAARSPAGLPARRERRAARRSSSAPGACPIPPEAGLAPVATCSRRWSAASSRRSTSSARTRPTPRRTSTTPSSCSRGSRSWWCRTCSSPKTAELADVVFPAARGLVRVRRHGDEQRATRAARAPSAAAAAGRARRHRDPRASSPAAWATTWGNPTAEEIWNELRAPQPDARRHELRAAGGLERPPVAVLRRDPSGRAVPARRLWERPVIGPAAPFARSSTSRRSTSSRRSSRSASRPAGGSTRTTRASRPRPTPRRCGVAETIDVSPEDARRLRDRGGRASCA